MHGDERHDNDDEQQRDPNKTQPRAAAWPPPVHVPPALETDEGVPEPPAELLCPIAHALMREPAISPAGVTYERAAIVQWLRTRGTEPSTGRACAERELTPNRALRSVIERWVADATAATAAAPAAVSADGAAQLAGTLGAEAARDEGDGAQPHRCAAAAAAADESSGHPPAAGVLRRRRWWRFTG